MKKGDQRRQSILETAEQLFYKNGYEGTSVQDVLDVLRLSKGGFYHHFDSKMRLLEAICQQKVETASQYAEEALKQAGSEPVERLNALLTHAGLLNQPSVDFVGLMIRVAYAGEGALLRDSLKRAYIEHLLPCMRDVIKYGYANGVFAPAYPERMAELLLNLGACLTDEIGFTLARKRSPESTIDILERLNAYRHAVETLLNAPYGSVQLYEMPVIVALIRELDEQDRRLSGVEHAR